MTKQLTAGKAATILIALIDDNDAAVRATAVSWKLYDGRGVELFAGTCNGITETDTIAKVELTAPQTATSDPLVAREIILTCTTASGVIEVRDFYLIVSAAPLAVAVNSFQTVTEAHATRALFARLDGWDASDKFMRAAAMREAYARILRVSLQLNASAYSAETQLWPNRRVPLSRLDQAGFDALPVSFKNAVKRAQIVEADVLLGGDKIGDKRREGVVSETVGEASMFLNSKPYLNLPISKKAYDELKAFAVLVIGLSRA